MGANVGRRVSWRGTLHHSVISPLQPPGRRTVITPLATLTLNGALDGAPLLHDVWHLRELPLPLHVVWHPLPPPRPLPWSLFAGLLLQQTTPRSGNCSSARPRSALFYFICF